MAATRTRKTTPPAPIPLTRLAVSNVNWQQNVDPFTGAALPQLGAMGVHPHYRIPYAMNFSLNMEKKFGKTTLARLAMWERRTAA